MCLQCESSYKALQQVFLFPCIWTEGTQKSVCMYNLCVSGSWISRTAANWALVIHVSVVVKLRNIYPSHTALHRNWAILKSNFVWSGQVGVHVCVRDCLESHTLLHILVTYGFHCLCNETVYQLFQQLIIWVSLLISLSCFFSQVVSGSTRLVLSLGIFRQQIPISSRLVTWSLWRCSLKHARSSLISMLAL